MIEASTLSRWEAIYTFIDNRGQNTHIHAERLRQHLEQNKPTAQLVSVSRAIAAKFLQENTISIERAYQLTATHLRDPIIFCEDGTFTNGRPDVMLVDGHHRYFRAALDGHTFIASYLIKPAIWREFQIIGISPLSQTALKNLPITKRTY